MGLGAGTVYMKQLSREEQGLYDKRLMSVQGLDFPI